MDSDLESCGGRKPIGPIRWNAEKVQGGNLGLGILGVFNVIEKLHPLITLLLFSHFILCEARVAVPPNLGCTSDKRLKAPLPVPLTTSTLLKTS